MVVVGIAWIVSTPYCLGLAVASSEGVNKLVASHLPLAATVGWSAVAALLLGVLVVGGNAGLLIAACAAPFAGLAFFVAGRRRDGGSGRPERDDQPTPGDAVDWDLFMRELQDWRDDRARVTLARAGRD